MRALLAPVLFLPVPLLQGLGYVGTCTQNDIDPFLSGAVLSLPFAVAAFGLAWHSRRSARSALATASHRALMSFANLVLIFVSAQVLLMNAALARDTLVLGLSPCGAEHTEAHFETEYILIGAIYGLSPLAILITALAALHTARTTGKQRA